jgi:hypothetical protein
MSESLEEMSVRFKEMEKEAQKLKEMQQVVEENLTLKISEEEKQQVDARY